MIYRSLRKTVCLLTALCVSLSLAVGALAAYESKTYLYGGTTASYISRIEKTGKNLNVVCPDYFEISASGTLKYSKSVDPLLLATMRDKGITVTPFLSNHWNRDLARLMLSRRTQAARELANAVVEHGLDGLDIDIQNINENDRAAFSDFIRLLRGAMPEETLLTVCVPANPYYTTTGWQGGYDYAELGRHCDHVFIMTYDESYPGGEPGPVASYRFIERSIQYGLQYVPKEKLFIGIPFYGRYWKQGVKGEAFTISDIERIVSSAPSTLWYDEVNECARASVTVPAGGGVTTWGGKALVPGEYDIWYENARSFEKKLSLVRKYDIGGAGSWALGQEPVEIWGSYYAWLNGAPFADIGGHWAQSYILELNERGIINGVGTGLFAPEGPLKRAEAAALLVRLAGREDIEAQSPFTDTRGHWAEKQIAAAFAAELVNGVTETTFEPDRYVTREEFAVMAQRYLNIEDTFDVSEPVYSDVSAEQNGWSIRAIIKLSINNVLTGYQDGTFRPKNNVTRAEAAKIISLISQLPTRFLEDKVLPLEKERMGPR